MALRFAPWLLAAPVSLAVLLLVVFPCIDLLLQSFRVGGTGATLTLDNYAGLLESRAAQQATIRTFKVSLWVTLFTVLAGYPLAFSIARQTAFGRGLLLSVVIFPFLLSAVVRAYGWNILLGENGFVNQTMLTVGLISSPLRMLHTDVAIIIGETHLLMPYMVLSLLAVIRNMDANLALAAQSLGASPPVVFFRVLLPMTLPGLITGTLLVFALAMTAFATPLLLGGTRSPVLTTLLYRYAFTSFDWGRASAVGGLLLVFGATFMIVHRIASQRSLRRQGGLA